VIPKRTSLILVVFLFLLLWVWIGAPTCPAQEKAERPEDVDLQQKEEPEKIVGAPQDVKQKFGIWVYVAWMWVSVFVLIFFLRLKIKEADRLYRLRFFSAKKE
jgi:hypothetical protein